tara:strand:- start:402 stop:521 length:120 start_codon:yes stop_codon:yes gene_type:complete
MNFDQRFVIHDGFSILLQFKDVREAALVVEIAFISPASK